MVARRDPVLVDLLHRYGRTFAQEVGIRLGRGGPGPLFQLLCASTLYGARISATIATAAARALIEAGWTTPARMAASSWEERTRVLNRSGYARYDESTSRRLGAMAEKLERDYGGDLRRLRREAGGEAREERRLLRRFTGVGEVSVDIFFRELQGVWPELYPFADSRALKAAAQLGLPRTAGGLAGLVPRGQLPTLVAALVRCELDKGHRERERSRRR